MKREILFCIILIAVVVVVLAILLPFKISVPGNNEKVDCSKPFNIVFLKPNEKHMAPEIGRGNTIVLIPEDNSIIAQSEVLLCRNFDHSYYMNLMEKAREINQDEN